MSAPSPESVSRNGTGDDAEPNLSVDPALASQASSTSPRAPARNGADARHPAEYSRLETLLLERARDVQQHRGELGRIKALLRDASVDFERVLAAAEPHEKIELACQRDAAVARALDAEAARAEALFRLDELMGHLADAPSPEAAGGSEATDPGDHAARADVFEHESARLASTVGELEAALAASRSELEQVRSEQQVTASELLSLRARAQAMESELEAASQHQSHADGMSDALRDTRRLLSELARAVQRVARGVGRRDSTTGAADPGPDSTPE